MNKSIGNWRKKGGRKKMEKKKLEKKELKRKTPPTVRPIIKFNDFLILQLVFRDKDRNDPRFLYTLRTI